MPIGMRTASKLKKKKNQKGLSEKTEHFNSSLHGYPLIYKTNSFFFLSFFLKTEIVSVVSVYNKVVMC